MPTDKLQSAIEALLPELDGGVLLQKLERALSETAEGVIHNDKKGKVVIEFVVRKITDNQVELIHKLAYTKPTGKGKTTEESTTSTPVHVGSRGKLTIFPESQVRMFAEDGTPLRQNQT